MVQVVRAITHTNGPIAIGIDLQPHVAPFVVGKVARVQVAVNIAQRISHISDAGKLHFVAFRLVSGNHMVVANGEYASGNYPTITSPLTVDGSGFHVPSFAQTMAHDVRGNWS